MIDHIGTIQLKDMVFFARHGCFAEERTIGNKFIVNLSLTADVKAASESDHLEDAVNYQEVYRYVKEEMDIPSNLLEHVAARILKAVKKAFPEIREMTVTIDKLNPPIGGQVYASSVTMSL